MTTDCETALHSAARVSHPRVVRRLLEAGAKRAATGDPAAKSNDAKSQPRGPTALDLAPARRDDTEKAVILELLRTPVADVGDARDERGSPLAVELLAPKELEDR